MSHTHLGDICPAFKGLDPKIKREPMSFLSWLFTPVRLERKKTAAIVKLAQNAKM